MSSGDIPRLAGILFGWLLALNETVPCDDNHRADNDRAYTRMLEVAQQCNSVTPVRTWQCFVQLADDLRADATPWTDHLARALCPEQPERPLKHLCSLLKEREQQYPNQSSKVQRNLDCASRHSAPSGEPMPMSSRKRSRFTLQCTQRSCSAAC
jgi:hypothetical protein